MLTSAILQIALSMGLTAHPPHAVILADSGTKMEWAAPQFAAGDVIAEKVSIQNSFPGMDLVTLSGNEGYVRGDEHIYRVNKTTLVVLEVIPIEAVILH